MIMMKLVGLIPLLLLLGLAHGLDVELEKISCNPDLPVTADLYLKCEGGSRCTFGNTTSLTGTSKSLRERLCTILLDLQCRGYDAN